MPFRPWIKIPALLLVLSIALSGSLSLAADRLPINLGSADEEVPNLVPPATTPIVIDALLDEGAWRNALVLELNYEFDPGENVPAPVRTEVLLTYDDYNLYAAFRCWDDHPDDIRAHITDREECFGDDHVNIHIDTFNDERRNFTIGTNALGVQMDAVAAVNRGWDWSWDGIWESAGRITEWGYVVEYAIPFNQLRFQRTNGSQVWGFDAWRVYPRGVEHFIGVIPQDLNNNCWQCQMIKIHGFAGVAPGRNLEVSPTVTAARTDERSDLPGGDFQRGAGRNDFGATAKWGLTPNLTLSGTLNPDFSQVEADALQMDINEPFALYYSEKRPFFTEGADFFRTLKDAIYTRTMHEPAWGLKLTGKEGVHTIGAYAVRDSVTNLIFPGSQESSSASLSRGSTASVLRYKRDIGSRYTLGALFTDREDRDYLNRVLGFDADLRPTEVDQFQLQLLGSVTRYPNETAEEFDQPVGKINDTFIAFEYDRSTRNNYWWLDYDQVGPDFRADLGFIPRVGFRNVEGGYFHTWIADPGLWWSRFRIGWEANYYEDFDGNLLQKGGVGWLTFQGVLQSYLHIRAHSSREAYNDREFDLTYYSLQGGFNPSGNASFWLYTRVGDRIDYDNTRHGRQVYISPELEFKLGKHLQLDVEHGYQCLVVAGGRLYTANISELAVIYQFNTRTFLRCILQYRDYQRDPSLYLDEIDAEEQHLFTQLLFSYKINPQTVFFLGYSDNHDGTPDYSLTRSDRSFFLKLGYAWLL
ncbi:MAG: carbohydrate binding family 9 domain-containing protein [Fidelibacterota bacterium]|nr:MAG: carbohydrate binding family 9 domain-containing protein [Candidatus Neomarinimicrobiota bacterium]